jgi:hypothetical protein
MATQPNPPPDRVEPQSPPETPVLPEEPVEPVSPDETPTLPPDVDEPGIGPDEAPTPL